MGAFRGRSQSGGAIHISICENNQIFHTCRNTEFLHEFALIDQVLKHPHPMPQLAHPVFFSKLFEPFLEGVPAYDP
jgi:hypothetical protein